MADSADTTSAGSLHAQPDFSVVVDGVTPSASIDPHDLMDTDTIARLWWPLVSELAGSSTETLHRRSGSFGVESAVGHHNKFYTGIDPTWLCIRVKDSKPAPTTFNLPPSEAEAHSVSWSETSEAHYSSAFTLELNTGCEMVAPATIGDHDAADTKPSQECTHLSSQPMMRAAPFPFDVVVLLPFACEPTPAASTSSSSTASPTISPIQLQAHRRGHCTGIDTSPQVKTEIVRVARSALNHTSVDCGWNNCGTIVPSGELLAHVLETHVHHWQDSTSAAERVWCRWTGCTLPHAIMLQSLEKHLFSTGHIGLRVECPRCNRTFARGDALRRHLNGRRGTSSSA